MAADFLFEHGAKIESTNLEEDGFEIVDGNDAGNWRWTGDHRHRRSSGGTRTDTWGGVDRSTGDSVSAAEVPAAEESASVVCAW